MIRIFDLIFCRLIYLYRKEEGEAIDSASNFLTTIILVIPLSIIGSIVNIWFRPEDGWDFELKRSELILIIAPICFIVSYLIKKTYKKRITKLDVIRDSKVLKFNLLILWIFICIFIFMPGILPKVV